MMSSINGLPRTPSQSIFAKVCETLSNNPSEGAAPAVADYLQRQDDAMRLEKSKRLIDMAENRLGPDSALWVPVVRAITSGFFTASSQCQRAQSLLNRLNLTHHLERKQQAMEADFRRAGVDLADVNNKLGTAGLVANLKDGSTVAESLHPSLVQVVERCGLLDGFVFWLMDELSPAEVDSVLDVYSDEMAQLDDRGNAFMWELVALIRSTTVLTSVASLTDAERASFCQCVALVDAYDEELAVQLRDLQGHVADAPKYGKRNALARCAINLFQARFTAEELAKLEAFHERPEAQRVHKLRDTFCEHMVEVLEDQMEPLFDMHWAIEPSELCVDLDAENDSAFSSETGERRGASQLSTGSS